jgi:hypothetical protein
MKKNKAIIKKKDPNKLIRDSLDENLEEKFMKNLQWSMLFFCFNQICTFINEENELSDEDRIEHQFIKNWQNFAKETICKEDIKIINNILSSPKNLFFAALQNEDVVTESTEIYQEKYNAILQKIVKFFLNSTE